MAQRGEQEIVPDIQTNIEAEEKETDQGQVPATELNVQVVVDDIKNFQDCQGQVFEDVEYSDIQTPIEVREHKMAQGKFAKNQNVMCRALSTTAKPSKTVRTRCLKKRRR